MSENDKDKEKESDSKEKSWLADAVKELSATGLAALFMTEDSIRGYFRDKKLPKELMSLLVDGAAKKRDDLYQVVAKELARMFSKVNITQEMTRFLENHRIDIAAKVSFEPRDDRKKAQTQEET